MIPATTLSIQAKTSHTKLPEHQNIRKLENQNAGRPECRNARMSNSPHTTLSPMASISPSIELDSNGHR